MRRHALLLLGLAGAALTGLPFASVGLSGPDSLPPVPREEPGPLPVVFEPNQGQFDEGYSFLARAGGYQAFLSATDAVLVFDPARPAPAAPGSGRPGSPAPARLVRLHLAGADPGARLEAGEPGGGRVNYLLGADPAGWRVGIPTAPQVHAANVYPGIGVTWHGQDQTLEYRFTVAPGADPAAIVIEFDGAEHLEVTEAGDLVVALPDEGAVYQPAPRLYQEGPEGSEPVDGRYVVLGANRAGFDVGAYDAARPLVIDPVLALPAHLGAGEAAARSVAVDGDGHAYIAGDAEVVVSPAATAPAPDAFVAKLAPDGGRFVYLTFLGGTGADVGYGVDVDGAGGVHLAGATDSADFPAGGTPPEAARDGSDAFVVRLDADGAGIRYGRVFGGEGPDIAVDVAVDRGDAWITGVTQSDDFPADRALTPAAVAEPAGFAAEPAPARRAGVSDAFVTRLDEYGEARYSMFVGGSGDEIGWAIAVDAGQAYLAGYTTSDDFPTTAGALAEYAPSPGGAGDGFVVKVRGDGTGALYSTYLGGCEFDEVTGIAVHDGRPYVTGATASPDFPRRAAAYPALAGDGDAFVAGLAAGGGDLVFSTFFGGEGNDEGAALAVDRRGVIHVAGTTRSTDLRLPPGTVEGALEGPSDGFVATVRPGGTVDWAAYVGGAGPDAAFAVAAGPADGAFVAGRGTSGGFMAGGPAAPGAVVGTPQALVARVVRPSPAPPDT